MRDDKESAFTDRTQLIVDVFREALPADEVVTAHTDFFEAGGNSVLAARVVARLRSRIGVAVSLPDLFRARTAQALADRASGLR